MGELGRARRKVRYQRDEWRPLLVRRQYQRQGFVDPGEREALNALLKAASGGALLDVGVGAGRTIPILSQQSERYVGVDLSPAMIAAARRSHPGVDLRVRDATDLSDFSDGQFDAVVFSFNGLDLVSHEDRQVVLSELSRVLRPGGYLALSSLNRDGVSFKESPVLHRPRPSVNTEVVGKRGLVRRLMGRALSLCVAPLAFYNFAKTAPLARWGDGWAEWPLRVHEFRFIAHFSTLAAMRRELTESGFSLVGVWDTCGELQTPSLDTVDADYLHLLCRRDMLSA